MLSTSILQHVKLYEIFKTIFQQTVRPVVWLPQYTPPPPASGDLNSHPDLSAWRSPRMSVMRLIILHLYTKVDVRRLSHSEDMADFRSRR